MYDYLPENVREMLKNDFAFVSYCQANSTVSANVKKMVEALRRDGINIVYDENGALQAATNIQLFMNLIYDDKCKAVLVIIDDEYVKKVKNQSGGVFTEYKIIAGNISDNPLKYIPVKTDDSMLDIFKPELYLKMMSCSSEEIKKIAGALGSCRKNDSFDDIVINSEKYINKCEYEIVYYTIDPKKILVDIDKIDDSKLYNNLKILNYRLIALLNLKKVDEYTETIRSIEKLINLLKNKKIEVNEYIYYMNISLAYRELENEYDVKKDYVKYAKLAYLAAKDKEALEIYDYEMMYSVALYESKIYSDALAIAKDAYDDFKELVSSGKTDDNALKKLKLLTNLAEINRYIAKNYKQRKKKEAAYNESIVYITKAINIFETENNQLDEQGLCDKDVAEVFMTAGTIFTEYAILYS